MLNFIYYPVSGIMWVWHWLFSHVLPDSPGGSGVAWALSVVFLVFTLRAILYKPFVKQVRTTRQMQEIQPQLQAIRKKYAKDRVKMTEEMQKLQKEHGFNPLLGCLPMLAQVPVFIGLFHVLRSFNRTGHGIGQLGLEPEQTRSIGNYVFSPDQVADFLDARLFGVPLSAYVTEPKSEWAAFVKSVRLEDVDFTRAHIIYLVIPLVILSSIATHMNSRASVARQGAAAMENPQTAIMNKLALYVFPLGILVSGAFFPVAILLYWVSNNLWTYAQQHIVFGQIEKEEAAKKAAKQEKLKANAPKPGARPGKAKKRWADSVGTANGSASGDVAPDLTKSTAESVGTSAATNGTADATTTRAEKNGSTRTGSMNKAGVAKAGATEVGGSQSGSARAGASPGGKPRPGQRPRSNQQRKRKRR